MRSNGTLVALAAYIAWGVLPIYWRLIDHVQPAEILGHRMVWSLAVAVLLLLVRRQWRWLRRIRHQPSLLLPFLGSALLLGANWLTYIWAVNNGHIVESSLGYFINPLFNVLLGFLVLRERPRPWQWIAIGLAACGVTYLTLNAEGLLWIAVVLAFTFGLYGLIRKTAPLGALQGLSIEMTIWFVPGLSFLLYLNASGQGTFAHTDLPTTLLLAGTGIVTAFPLIWFAYGAQRVSMTTLGLLQYVAPTLQFLLGVLVYGESFGQARVIGFSIIWLALLLYSLEGIRWVRGHRRLPVPG